MSVALAAMLDPDYALLPKILLLLPLYENDGNPSLDGSMYITTS